jgi:Cd2+/Zn2+-exporting ATPase
MEKLEFYIEGLDCAEEVALLKRELIPLVGEQALSFDLLRSKLTVDSRQPGVTENEIKAAIAKSGLKGTRWQTHLASEAPSSWLQRKRVLLTVLSGVACCSGMAAEFLGNQKLTLIPATVLKMIYGVGIATGFGLVLPKAWKSLVSLRPDMNLLMTIAVFGAIAVGEWSEAATVSFLFSLSLSLESWSVDRARNAIGKLMSLSPLMANQRIPSGQIRQVSPLDIEIGSIIVVRPGEKIPIDGTIRRGTTSVDQSAITGESMPIPKGNGDPVFAGTLNGDGLIEIESTRLADDTLLAQIVKMVGDAHSKRAPSERWVERFASIYTPLVMIGALLVLVVPPLLFGGSAREWFYRSLVLLVIACPCALVISTPVSLVAALAAAARYGVLIKGGLFVELPARLRAIAIDKTGTLTEGKPAIVQIVPKSEHDENELLQIASALAKNNSHPLAQAILMETAKRGINPLDVEKFEILPGKGARGLIDGKVHWLASRNYLRELGQETPYISKELMDIHAAGLSVVVVGNESHVCGFLAFGDRIRAESIVAIRELKALGIQKIVLLTGDHGGTANAVGDAVGIVDIREELLPADKVDTIASLVDQFGNVAMIGDGVNDAPAMARATIGIAMGAVGSDAAIETADIALMSDDLNKIPWLIRHSRKTLATIQQNIIFSLAVKLIFVILTVAGISSLWGAIAADTGATLLVVANSLRLLKA